MPKRPTTIINEVIGNEPAPRHLWLDVVRVAAIFLMVMLHVAAGYVPLWSEQSRVGWWTANWFDALTRVCAPWLIMVSGALVLEQARVTVGQFAARQTARRPLYFPLNFYRRRLGRLIQPWLFWSVIFGAINLVQGNETSSITRLVMGTVWTGFWLLPVFLGLYLAAPFWAVAERWWGRIWAWGWLVVSGVLLIAGVHWPVYFEYSFYFVAGWLIARQRHRAGVVPAGWGWLAGVGASAWGTYVLIRGEGIFDPAYYLFNSWPVVLAAVSGFMLIRQLNGWWERALSPTTKRSLTNLSKISFHLYFIHLLFFRLPFAWRTLPSLVFIPVFSLMIFGGSWVGVWLLRQNRWLAKLSGAEERT